VKLVDELIDALDRRRLAALAEVRHGRRDAIRAPRPSQDDAGSRTEILDRLADAYSLQVRSAGQPPLQSVEMLAGSGHHWSTQQLARRIASPYAPFRSDI
jgi:hypothetical protein